jgi:soluble lytic murein transglycosylase-like protein
VRAGRRSSLALLMSTLALAGWSPSGAATSTYASSRIARSRRPAPLPSGYRVMGERYGVPPLVLYGVALQESAQLFGDAVLPWPWTLNVQGTGRRYASHAQAATSMRSLIAAGIRNIDAGLMQVNWGWHRAQLIDPVQALDPYPNIAVGAQILRAHFAQTGQWHEAIGRYHSPGNAQRAAEYARRVHRRMAQVPGLDAGGRT